MPFERAWMWVYDIRTNKWSRVVVDINIDKDPFSEGSFRKAYRATIQYKNHSALVVCKWAKDVNTPRFLYQADIKSQAYSALWAAKFNQSCPHKISYAFCFLLELVERPGRPVCAGEQMLAGAFRKYNNNVGASRTVDENDADSHAAQAFSHFTFEESGGRVLICDIQGAGSLYTDPQINTLKGKAGGEGNIGLTGIQAFLLRHQCTPLCKEMKLTALKAGALKAEDLLSKMNGVEMPNPGSSMPSNWTVGGLFMAAGNASAPATLAMPKRDRDIALSTVQSKTRVASRQASRSGPPSLQH